MSKQATQYEFQAEVNEVLNLVIHSLYSNKEIFLRELISNASDANDKLRFAALNNDKLYENDSDLAIHISVDKENKTLTVRDNGIGMSEAEVIEHLGTIAKSGTKEFLNQLTGDQKNDSHLIGQFGVGFYSAFIVADKVTVNTRRAGEDAGKGVCWVSEGKGAFTLTPINKPERGTEIILHLKQDEEEFLDSWKVRNIVTQYSDHIGWPVKMKKAEPVEEAKEGETVIEEEETVNSATALWTLPKKDIKDKEYIEFYKHISHDFEDPLTWRHNHVEGKQSYTSLLYIPNHVPFDLWTREAKHGLKLFVKRVFIMDDADQFLPRYLRFVKGVIDSSDLPLNVSRELLQDNRLVSSMRNAVIKRVLGMLEDMASKKPDDYQKFWTNFGPVLKEGPVEDFANKDQIAKLLRFASTHNDSDAQITALADYIERMDEKQEKIYYLTADSYTAAVNSPHLEVFRKKGIEVLLLTDKIDEWLVGYLTEFDGKKLQSIAKGELDLNDIDDQAEEKVSEAEEKVQETLVKRVKNALDEKVKEVRVTHRLTDSPSCVVVDDSDMGLQMQQILKAAGQDAPTVKPIFELNPKHPIVTRMQQETDDNRFKDWAELLFEQAMLVEGAKLENPAAFVKRMNSMLAD